MCQPWGNMIGLMFTFTVSNTDFCLVTRLGKIEGKMEKIVYQSNLASISTKSEDALQLTVTVLIQKYPLWKLIKKNVKTYRSDRHQIILILAGDQFSPYRAILATGLF